MADRRRQVVIAFASFKYDAGLPVRQVGRRGETIEVNDADYKRGKRLKAFVDSADDLVRHGDLPSLGEGASENEIAHWMRSATLSDIQAVLEQSPDLDLLAALQAGEQSRGSETRPEVTELLTEKVSEAETPETPAKSASKADWIAYATDEARGEDRLLQEDAEALTRDALVEKYTS